MFTWDRRRRGETLVGQGVPDFYLAQCGGCCLSSVMEETVHIARNPRMRLTALLLLDRCGVDKRPITSGTGRMDFIFTWPAFLAPSTCDPTQRHTPYRTSSAHATAHLCIYAFMRVCVCKNLCLCCLHKGTGAINLRKHLAQEPAQGTRASKLAQGTRARLRRLRRTTSLPGSLI